MPADQHTFHTYEDTVVGAKQRQALAHDFANRGEPFTENCIRRVLDCLAMFARGEATSAHTEARKIARMGAPDV